MTKLCLNTFKGAEIYVPNPCAKLIVKSRKSHYKKIQRENSNQLHLFSATAEDWAKYTCDLQAATTETPPEFTMTWLDACGQCNDGDFRTMELFPRLKMVRANGPSIAAFTYSHRGGRAWQDEPDEEKEKRFAESRYYAKQRSYVDQWVDEQYRSNGFRAIKTALMMLPRLKGTMYTWIYLIVPDTWECNKAKLDKLEADINSKLQTYRETQKHPIFNVVLYDPQPLSDKL